MRPILVGAVIYDPKVSVIWDIIREHFAAHDCPIDCVYYTNYELMVDALLAGHIDVAWNSPLAWVDAQRRSGGRCRALAMRDTDRDRVTRIIVRVNGARRPVDLRHKVIATGAVDSPQSTLLPLLLFHREGMIAGRDFTLRRFDRMIGKHGDHMGGELEALESLISGASDAAALLDLNWDLWSTDGTVDPDRFRILVSTPPFDHCNFTAHEHFSPERSEPWTRALFAMRYEVPEHQRMMDLEGLKAWLPGRVSGYGDLEQAAELLDFFSVAPR